MESRVTGQRSMVFTSWAIGLSGRGDSWELATILDAGVRPERRDRTGSYQSCCWADLTSFPLISSVKVSLLFLLLLLDMNRWEWTVPVVGLWLIWCFKDEDVIMHDGEGENDSTSTTTTNENERYKLMKSKAEQSKFIRLVPWWLLVICTLHIRISYR